LVPLYRLALGARARSLRTGLQSVRRLRSPVLSIGSLSAGGAGKTPLTIALARALTARGFSIDVLSRGHGRLSREAARVDTSGTADDFGDEPLEIARAAAVPVYVAAQRYDAGLLAERAAEQAIQSLDRNSAGRDSTSRESASGRAGGRGFSPGKMQPTDKGALAPEGSFTNIHLLDDGFQHRQLHRDIDIVLLSRHDLDDRLLPAGNLREPLRALRRATILAVPAEDANLAGELHWEGPVWRLRRKMEIPSLDGPIVAFCGIARPEQFFAGLQNAGAHLAAQITFPDHRRYTPADLARLMATAQSAGAAAFLTTEKDRMRLGNLATQLTKKLPLATAGLAIEIEGEEAAISALLENLTAAPGPNPASHSR
jgi:tetraacyldisaccharide 4'-kinase